MAALTQRIKLRRDTNSAWGTGNPVLGAGEVGVVTDAATDAVKLKIGDGTTAWTSLPFYAPSSAAPSPAWTPTTDGMTLLLDGQYILQPGHTVTLPTGTAGKSLLMLPANGNWETLGANINPPAGWTLALGQGAILASGEIATFAIPSGTNYVITTGGETAPTEVAMQVTTKTASFTTTQSDFGSYIRWTAGVPTVHAPTANDIGRHLVLRNVTGAQVTVLQGAGATVSGSLIVAANETLVVLCTGAGTYDATGGL